MANLKNLNLLGASHPHGDITSPSDAAGDTFVHGAASDKGMEIRSDGKHSGSQIKSPLSDGLNVGSLKEPSISDSAEEEEEEGTVTDKSRSGVPLSSD